jgi:hypothetical protein
LLPAPSLLLTSPQKRYRIQHIEYGTSHPDFGRLTPKKVEWTADEVQFLKAWKTKHILTEEDTFNQVAHCLAAIREDPDAHPIFHAHHVQDSSRLRCGYFKT